MVTSDAGAVLLGATELAIRLVERLAACLKDGRLAEHVLHSLGTPVGQRVFGLALGYADPIDHDRLRRDPILAVLAGGFRARRPDCAPLAGKSTPSRPEHAPAAEPPSIEHDGAARCS